VGDPPLLTAIRAGPETRPPAAGRLSAPPPEKTNQLDFSLTVTPSHGGKSTNSKRGLGAVGSERCTSRGGRVLSSGPETWTCEYRRKQTPLTVGIPAGVAISRDISPANRTEFTSRRQHPVTRRRLAVGRHSVETAGSSSLRSLIQLSQTNSRLVGFKGMSSQLSAKKPLALGSPAAQLVSHACTA
jgi:hypothetical protein